MATWSLGESGFDFATWALAEDFVDSVNGTGILSEDEIFQQNNEELLTTSDTVWDGATPGVFSIVMEAQPGDSFRDHANAATNALRYNSANGACVRRTTGSGSLFTFNDENIITRNLMFKKDSDYSAVLEGISSQAGRVLQNCIVERALGGGTSRFTGRFGTYTVENCVFITRDDSIGIRADSGDSIYSNITVLSTVSNPNTGFNVVAGSPTLKNVAVFGFDIDYGGTANAASTNNSTHLVAFGGTNFGTSGQTSAVGSTELESVTDGTHDLRIAATSVKLKGNGTSSGVPTTDIIGQTRAGNFDIGAWEFTSGGATTFPISASVVGPHSQIVNRSAALSMGAVAGHSQTATLLRVILQSFSAARAHVVTAVFTIAIPVSAIATAVRSAIVRRQGNISVGTAISRHNTPVLVGSGTIKGIATDTVTNAHAARVTKSAILNFSAIKTAIATVVVGATATIAVNVSTTVSYAVQIVRTANIFARARSVYEQAALPTFISGGAKIYAIVVSAVQGFTVTMNEQAQRLKRPFTGGAGLGIHLRVKRKFRRWGRRN